MHINHEEVIMEAFKRMLTRAGETEPEKVATRENFNNFKRDHVIKLQESNSIPAGESVSIAQLAQYVSEKYPMYDLTHYKKEAGSKKNQYDLGVWWSKFQERAHRDLNSDDDFTALAKHVSLLRARLRATEEAQLKAQAKREPEKLAEWKSVIDQVSSVPHLENWHNAHWAEVKASMPHEEDQDELLIHFSNRNWSLKKDFAKAMNEPPPPEDQEVPQSVLVETGDEQRKDETALQEEVQGGQEETEGSKDGGQGGTKKYIATFKVEYLGTDPDKANNLFKKVWELVEEMGGVASVVK